MRIFAWIMALAAVTAWGSSTKAQDIQTVGPIKTYTQRLQSDTYVKPSISEKLPAGARVDIPPFIIDGTLVIQRLTDRTYWIAFGSHMATAFVGDDGVLLVDAPIVTTPDKIIAAVAQITDLPIRALVISHPHTDHNGNAAPLRDALKAQSIDLRIITSEQGLTEIRRYRSLPEPTQVLPNGRATFFFEDFEFVYATPVRWAHTGADSYTITPDGVVTFIDFVYPGALPFQEVSVVQNLTGYLEFVRHIAGEPDWVYANLGHSNVGNREDLMRTLEYFEDLYTNWVKLIGPKSHDPYPGEQGVTNTAVSLKKFFDQSAEELSNSMKEKWGTFSQFEVVRDHATEVHKDMYLNYAPWLGAIPEFTPIEPKHMTRRE